MDPSGWGTEYRAHIYRFSDIVEVKGSGNRVQWGIDGSVTGNNSTGEESSVAHVEMLLSKLTLSQCEMVLKYYTSALQTASTILGSLSVMHPAVPNSPHARLKTPT